VEFASPELIDGPDLADPVELLSGYRALGRGLRVLELVIGLN